MRCTLVAHGVQNVDKLVLIQNWFRSILGIKKWSANKNCCYTLEPIRVSKCLRVFEGDVYYMIDAVKTMKFFWKTNRVINPFTMREFTSVEFIRLARKSMHRFDFGSSMEMY